MRGGAFIAIMEPGLDVPVVRPEFFRKGLSFVVAFLLLLFCALPVTAHARPDRPCTVENARRITVAEVSIHLKKLERACVQISGITDGWNLYGSIGDIYRTTDGWKERRPKQSKAGRIGLRSFPEMGEEDEKPESGTWKWSSALPHRVTVIGWLHNCALDWSRGDSNGEDVEISMGTGWCHYNGGAVLRPVAITAEEPAELVRMTGSRARKQFGDIVPAAKASALRDEAVLFTKWLIAAARRGDQRALLDLHGYTDAKLTLGGKLSDDNDEDIASGAQNVLDRWFGHSGTVMSQTARSAKEPILFVYEPRWEGTDIIDFWVCWAPERLSDAERPISSLDTDNIVGRPYACVELFKSFDRPGLAIGSGDSKWVFKERSARPSQP